MVLSKKIILISIFLLSVLQNIFSQTQKIDSLNNLLKNKFLTDSARIEILYSLSEEIYRENIDSAKSIADQILILTEKTKYKKGKAYYHLICGLYFRYNSQYDQALIHDKRATEIFKVIKNTDLTALAYNDVGVIYYYKNNYSKALKFYRKSITLYKRTDNYKKIAREYNNIAVVFKDLSNYNKALDYYLEALKITEKSKDEFVNGVIYLNIGDIYDALEQPSKALEYYIMSLKIREKVNDNLGLIVTLNYIAEIYLNRKEYETAMKYFKKSLEISKKTGTDYVTAYNYSGIAKIYESRNEFQTALYYHTEALKIRIKVNEKSETAISYNEIAMHYFSRKNYQISALYAEKAHKLATEIGNPEIILNSDKILYQAYQKLQNYKKAFEHYSNYNQQLFANLNNANTKKITELELKYKFEKKEQDLKINYQKDSLKAEKEIHKQKLIIIAIFVILILAVIATTAAILSNNQKRKANIILETQKQQIALKNTELSSQNKEIKEINEELKTQKNKIEIQHEHIKSSIRYAKTIQNDILPKEDFLSDFEHFLIFKSKDIVSGDFYWYTSFTENQKKYTFVAVADSTGHGVPGAFLSVIGHRLLNETIKEKKIFNLSDILIILDKSVISTLNQQETDNSDGMDIALIKIEQFQNQINVEFAGAHRSILFYDFKNRKLIKIKGDINSIGGFIKLQNFSKYTVHNIKIQKNDIIYLTTDGFVDQNNDKRKKFGAKRFFEMIQEIAHLPLKTQKSFIENTYEVFSQNTAQRDDITILAVKF